MSINIATNLNKALGAALDAAAEEQGPWVDAWATFWDSQSEECLTIGEALSKALDVAANDGQHWLAGEKAFNEGLDGSWRNSRPGKWARRAVKTNNGRGKVI